MLSLAVYVHNLDPFAIEFPHGWSVDGVRWYGLSYLFGFFLAYLLIKRIVRVGISTIKPEEVGDLIVALAFGVVIGGRLGYCVFYDRHLITEFDGGFPFWGVLRINKGGMASHGGIIGGIVACWWYARAHKHSWPHILDMFGYGAPLGLFFGRIANFINGELFGRPVPPGSAAMSWAVKFPQEMDRWNPGDPADAEKFKALEEAVRHLPSMTQAKISTVGDEINAVLYAIQHGNNEVRQIIAPVLTPRYPSQLVEALLEGLVVFAVLAILWWKPRKPLVIGGAFALTYGIVRILGEFVREPDAQLINAEFAHFGVTRGQVLSVFLVITGVVLLAIFTRRPGPKMGSWRKQPKADEASSATPAVTPPAR